MAPPQTAMLVSVMPDEVDLTSLLPVVRDQGRLGTCTANAILEAMGFLYTKDGRPDPQLSRLYTYYMSRKIEGTPPTEDSGCMIPDAVKSVQVYGSCLEMTWPYADDDETFTKEPSHTADVEARNHQLLLDYTCPSLATIMASLAQGFPLVFGFSCPENMFSDACTATGMIQMPGASEGFNGGHCVLATGYSRTKRLLKARNSWGDFWGDHGDLYLPLDFIHNQWATDFTTLRREEM